MHDIEKYIRKCEIYTILTIVSLQQIDILTPHVQK